MHVVLRIRDGDRSVDLQVNGEGVRVGELAAGIAGADSSDRLGLVVDGRWVPPGASVEDARIRRGSLLEPAASPPDERRSAPVAELRGVAGFHAGMRFMLAPGVYTLGSDQASQIRVDCPGVAERHVRFEVHEDGAVLVREMNGSTTVTIGGQPLRGQAILESGTPIRVGASEWEVGAPTRDLDGVAERAGRRGVTGFNRPPRSLEPQEVLQLAVPEEPRPPVAGARFAWAMLVAPIVVGGLMAALFSPYMAVFALLGPVLMVGTWWEDRRRATRERRDNAERLRMDVERFIEGLDRTRHRAEVRARREQPDVPEAVRRALVGSSELWERRPEHGDFMSLAVGVGDVPWHPPLSEARPRRPEAVDEALATFGWLRRVPVGVDAGSGRVVGLAGERTLSLALARSLVVQTAVHHGPADLRIAVVTHPARRSDWEWVPWLPHSAVDGVSGRRLVAATTEDLDALISHLATRVEDTHPFPMPGATRPEGPVTLLVVDAEELSSEGTGKLRDVLAGAGAPVAGLVLAPDVDRLPSVCTTVVEVPAAGIEGTVRVPSQGQSLPAVTLAGVDLDVAWDIARALARFDDPEVREEGADLPGRVSLLDVLALADPTPEAIVGSWRENGAHPTAPIGVTERGPLLVDIAGDGPHGLVAGTTGSGKSELLRSLVVSLAARCSPDYLTFVLVDYKGGSAFDACTHLPHVVGSVTDLDEHLGRRALTCLEAELRHRERVLRTVAASDITDYQARPGVAPLPRLLVIVDEFAALAAELPEFVSSLVDVAQRGRSLGVHLLLATQRPAGVVNDAIRANTNLRVALRVQSTVDSRDVLDDAVAAAIPRSAPGRGYVRLGPGELTPFHAALVSSRSGSGEGSADSVIVTPLVFGWEQPLATRTGLAGDDAGPTDLELLVEAIAGAALAEGVQPPRAPWPAGLPDVLRLDALSSDDEPVAPWSAPLGLADEPEMQRRRTYWWDSTAGNVLMIGLQGSGPSDTLASLVVSCATRHPADSLHAYVFDHGTRDLDTLEGLPHVGGVIPATDGERRTRLLRMLRAELERRRADNGRASAPAVLVCIDNYGGFLAALDQPQDMVHRDFLQRLAADGPGLGMYLVATADTMSALPSSMAALVPEKLVFRLADRFDYSALGLGTREVPDLPPGRAVHVPTGRLVQMAVVSDEDLISWAELDTTPTAGGPARVGVLPAEVKLADVIDTARLIDGEWSLPLGIGDEALSVVGLRLGEGDHALIAGPSRSGKSTALAAIAETVAFHRADVQLTAVAVRRSPLREVTALRRLVIDGTTMSDTIDEVLAAKSPQVVLVDDAEMVSDEGGDIARLLGSRRPDVHVVAAGRADELRSAYGHWTKEIRRSRMGVALRPHLDTDGDLWGAQLPRRGPVIAAAGRGYLVTEGNVELIQVAMP